MIEELESLANDKPNNAKLPKNPHKEQLASTQQDKAKVTTIKTLLAIARALGVTVDELFFP